MTGSIDFTWLADPEAWASLLTLVVLEIVLGVDNLIFIAVLANKLPDERRRSRARRIGLALALVTRLGLLASIAWLARLTAPLFDVLGHPVSWRDLILCGGGLFLIFKSTREIHDQLEGEEADGAPGRGGPRFSAIVAQIVVLDIVFSLDSVITAVGMASNFWIMASAVVVAVGIMLWASGPAARFVTEHPTVKMLALSFLLLIGTTLIADGAGFHVPKGYIYVAIAFSMLVEGLNQIGLKRARARRRDKALEHPPADRTPSGGNVAGES